jgi:transposase
MLMLAELHDFRRFASAPALMAYLGLVPGEDSSGEKHRRGRITRHGYCAKSNSVRTEFDDSALPRSSRENLSS